MKKLLLLLIPLYAQAGGEPFKKQEIVVLLKDGAESRHEVNRVDYSTEGGPNLYVISKHEGKVVEAFRYDQEIKFSREPSDEERFRAEQIVYDVTKDYPTRLVSSSFAGAEGARVLLKFLENAQNSYEIIYRQDPAFSRSIRKELRMERDGHFQVVGNYLERQYVVPMQNAVIRNKKTGKEQNLEDFTEYLLAVSKKDDTYYSAQLNTTAGSFLYKKETGMAVAGKDHELIAGKQPEKKPGRMPASVAAPAAESPFAEWGTHTPEIPTGYYTR